MGDMGRGRWTVAASLIAITACSHASQVDAGALLWVPDGAELKASAASPLRVVAGRNLYRDGSADVIFVVSGDRDTISAGVVQHFRALGWRQRRREYLNPTVPTSFDDGWRHVCGCVITSRAPVGTPQHYFTWHGEWQDGRGNVASYSLQADGQVVRGYATSVPQAIVRQALAARGQTTTIRFFFFARLWAVIAAMT
jgi:hypothetical protein